LTGRTWIAVAVSLAAFVALHLPTWSLPHVLGIVLPMGAVLTGLYLWKRNLPFVITVHLTFNAPLVVLALADDYGIPVDVPFSELRPEHLEIILHGVPERQFGGLTGFFRWLERRFGWHLCVTAEAT
jgi:hypothetical protein